MLGHGALPHPPLLHYDQLADGQEDSQWIELRGVVRSTEVGESWGQNVLFLNVEVGGGKISARVRNFKPADAERLVDAEVRIRGVSGTNFNGRRQFVGIRMFVNDIGEINVERPPPEDPFSTPIVPIRDILSFNFGQSMQHRIRVTGTVTYQRIGQGLFLQNEDQGIYVVSATRTVVPPGTNVEVVGFPAIGSYSPILESAQIRPLGAGPDVTPKQAVPSSRLIQRTSDGFVIAPYDSKLVRIVGQLVEHVQREHDQMIVLRDGDHIVNAILENSSDGEPLAQLKDGSTLEIVGVCAIQADDKRDPRSFELYMRSAKDLNVLRQPSWWDVVHTLELLGIALMAVAVSLTWIGLLRRQVRLRTAEVVVAYDSLKERTRELSNANIVVQNSPVLLYRLRGEPSFPLVYVSHNITRMGHDPKTLLASSNWAEQLIHSEDLAQVGESMRSLLNKDANGASIEFRLRAGDGSLRWVENRYVPVRDTEGRLIEVEGIVIDITERKAAEEKITMLARTDALTGLANRATFTERLAQLYAAAQRGANAFAILYLDLDKFKPVNDTFGHPVGDSLLQHVALRLKGCARGTDLIARLGGDEFAILQADMKEPEDAGTLAVKVQKALALPFPIDGHEIEISVSIGISAYSPESVSANAMLVQADLALYRSKNEGCNQYHFHSDELDREVVERFTLAGEIKKAIEQKEFELQYQPQIELSTGDIVGVEALIRWNHPARGLLAPGLFIPIAEKTGTMVALGRWVLDQACRQMSIWRKEKLQLPVMAVNLSLVQLKSGQELLRDVTDTLNKWVSHRRILSLTLPKERWHSSDGRKTQFSLSCASSELKLQSTISAASIHRSITSGPTG